MGEPRAGQVVRVGRALRARTGVVLAAGADGVLVLTKGPEPARLAAEEFGPLPAIEVEGPAVTGAAGRLMRAARAARAGTLKVKWDIEAVDTAAMTHASAGLGARRCAALDALALGLDATVDALGLTATETAWYRAWTAAAAGDGGLALYWTERLPPEAYAGKVRLLARCAPALMRDPDMARRAAAVLAPLAPRVEEARALAFALAPAASPETVTALEPAASAHGARERGIAAALVRAEPPPAPPPPELRLVRAFAVYLTGRTPGAVVDTDELVPLPSPLLDELADLRTLGGPPTSPDWPRTVAAHLNCRLDPGRASARDLAEAGFVAEQARRAYLAGDEDALRALPGGDPAVRHYGALLESRAAGAPCRPDDLRPEAREVLAEVAEIRARTGRGQKAAVSARLAADASCRLLLREAAGLGLLRPPVGPEDRSAFALWRDLCVLERRALDGEWDDAIPRGMDIAARTSGPVREEALNIVAYAEFRAGRPDVALKLLDDALETRRPIGLLVNAGVVAGADGAERAVSYLRSLAWSTSDDRVRRGAVLRAIGLWQAEKDSDYPPQLRDLVREALLVPEDDRGHRRALLAVADGMDSDWLAGAGEIPAPDSWQRDLLKYHRTRARSASSKYDTSLEDVAKVLVESPAHDWRREEVQRLAGLLNSLVHVTFGEAAHLFPVVDVLARGGVLDLADEIILSVQAGTHLATRFQEEDATLKEEVEKRLLLEPAEKYLARAGELPEGVREAVGEEVGRCVAVAGLGIGMVVERQGGDLAEQWNALVDREAWDYQNRYAIRNSKIALMREFQAILQRLPAYLGLLRRLPLDEAAEEQRRLLASSHEKWSSEVERVRSGM
ncbi:MAG TPA: hypothetical protein VFV01_18730 [Spirillospora sp.]|nr:hypothetical protein [Spirillospora sp.]